MVVQAAESACALGEKHETNLFVDGGKGVKISILLDCPLLTFYMH